MNSPIKNAPSLCIYMQCSQKDIQIVTNLEINTLMLFLLKPFYSSGSHGQMINKTKEKREEVCYSECSKSDDR